MDTALEPRQRLQAYRDRMEGPMEGLAITLSELGVERSMADDELVEFTTKKLKTLHTMLGSVVPPGILEAVMKEA